MILEIVGVRPIREISALHCDDAPVFGPHGFFGRDALPLVIADEPDIYRFRPDFWIDDVEIDRGYPAGRPLW